MEHLNLQDYKEIVSNYIYAKDGNRPHLMAGSFAEQAILEMKVETDKISFPSNTVGLAAISEVLVRRFGQSYDNVYTLCTSDSVKSNDVSLSCHWLVAMTDKESGEVRVGCGQYDWQFESGPNGLAKHLIITIQQMIVLDQSFTEPIIEWVSGLPYPWCDSSVLLETMPQIESLSFVTEFISVV